MTDVSPAARLLWAVLGAAKKTPLINEDGQLIDDLAGKCGLTSDLTRVALEELVELEIAFMEDDGDLVFTVWLDVPKEAPALSDLPAELAGLCDQQAGVIADLKAEVERLGNQPPPKPSVKVNTEALKEKDAKIEQLETDNGSLESNLSELRTKVERLQADLAKLESDLTAERSKSAGLEGDKSALERRVTELTAELAAAPSTNGSSPGTDRPDEGGSASEDADQPPKKYTAGEATSPDKRQWERIQNLGRRVRELEADKTRLENLVADLRRSKTGAGNKSGLPGV